MRECISYCECLVCGCASQLRCASLQLYSSGYRVLFMRDLHHMQMEFESANPSATRVALENLLSTQLKFASLILSQ